MILGVGSDIINIERVAKVLEEFPERFREKNFTEYEIEAAKKYNPDSKKKIAAHFAKRFAAKEAFAKAVGSGFGKYLSHKDIGIESNEDNKPSIIPNDRAAALLKTLSGGKDVSCHVSLSDDYPYAQALVILEVRD